MGGSCLQEGLEGVMLFGHECKLSPDFTKIKVGFIPFLKGVLYTRKWYK